MKALVQRLKSAKIDENVRRTYESSSPLSRMPCSRSLHDDDEVLAIIVNMESYHQISKGAQVSEIYIKGRFFC